MSKQLWPAAADQVDQIALPLEQNMQAPIAEAAALLGDRPHALTQGGIIRPERLVSDGHAATADGFTRPPFAHPVGIHEMRDSFPLPRGHHHFFPRASGTDRQLKRQPRAPSKSRRSALPKAAALHSLALSWARANCNLD